MSRRKARLGDEHRAHKVPAEGAGVFKPPKDDKRIRVHIPVDGKMLVARWPSSMGGSVQYGSPPREIIRMGEKQAVRVTYPDPYSDAEKRSAERKGAA